MRNMSDTFMAGADYFKCSTAPNGEVERRGAAVPEREADLSQSSIPSLAQRRRGPRSLEPIVRAAPTSTLGAADHAEPTIVLQQPCHRGKLLSKEISQTTEFGYSARA